MADNQTINDHPMKVVVVSPGGEYINDNPMLVTTGGGEGGGNPVAVDKDGSEVVADVRTLNFTGGNITVTDEGSGEVSIAVSGGGGGDVTASNGLTETDGDIKLGGVLTEDSAVDTNGHLFSISDSTGTATSIGISSGTPGETAFAAVVAGSIGANLVAYDITTENINQLGITPTETIVKNLVDPVDDGDAASKKYVDDNAGGGASGPLYTTTLASDGGSISLSGMTTGAKAYRVLAYIKRAAGDSSIKITFNGQNSSAYYAYRSHLSAKTDSTVAAAFGDAQFAPFVAGAFVIVEMIVRRAPFDYIAAHGKITSISDSNNSSINDFTMMMFDTAFTGIALNDNGGNNFLTGSILEVYEI